MAERIKRTKKIRLKSLYQASTMKDAIRITNYLHSKNVKEVTIEQKKDSYLILVETKS